MRLAAVAAAAVVLALPTAATGERASFATGPKGPPRTVVALKSGRGHDTLVRLHGRTLRPLGARRVALDGHAGMWVYSPDRRVLAVGVGEALGLNLVDTRKMRRLGRVILANGQVSVLTWPRRNRIVGVEDVAGLFVVDPLRRRMIRSERLGGSVYGAARAGLSLVLLLAPEQGIGTARLVVVDSDGNRRAVELDRIAAGSNVPHEEVEPGFVGEAHRPGLAVDGELGRAFVVGGREGLIAEVDLGSLTVAYRTPSPARSRLGRVHDWLEPAAQAKVPVGGTFRKAMWLGDGRLAVSGADTTVAGSGVDTTAPAGLSFVDTRDWSRRVVDERATRFVYTDGMLLTTGDRAGLTGYTAEGVRRFEVFPDDTVSIWDVFVDRAFVARDRRGLHVVNAFTGRVLGKRKAVPRLLHRDWIDYS